MLRFLFGLVGLVIALGLVLLALVLAGVIVPISASDSFGMAPTLPPCNGRELAETITYWFRDPHRGDIVAIHSQDLSSSNVTPDSSKQQRILTKRVIAVPGDTVSASHGHVFVNAKEVDSIQTLQFPSVHLRRDQYFVLGDNRSVSQDSRVFGPVPRSAIFARIVFNFWPISRVGIPGYDKHLTPPGFVCAQH